MRVLGIDCGSERTGFGVIDSDGAAHRMVAAGVIRTAAAHPLALRLLEIRTALRDVIEKHAPETGAVESIFQGVNVQSAFKLAHVRGVAMLSLAEAGLTVGEYSPAEVKTSVTGFGRAQKDQVQLMVHSLLHLESRIESEDACDAVAVAICHATRRTGVAMRAAL